MTYRGTNPNDGTVQIYDTVGTRWVSFNNLAFSEAGTAATLTAAGNLNLNGLNDASLVATAGNTTISGQTGVGISATTGTLQLNATDAAGDLVGTAGNDVQFTATAGNLTAVASAGFATFNGATGIGLTSSGGNINLTATTGFATMTADQTATVESSSANVNITAATTIDGTAAGNLTLVSTGAFTTLNGDTGVGITSANGNVNATSTTGFATLEAAQTATLRSTAANVLIESATTMTLDVNSGGGVLTVNASQTNFSGNVTVAGSSMAVDSQITLADRFIDLNMGQTAPGATTAGMNANTNSVGPSTSVAGGAFVSATRVEVADTTGMAADDVIEIANAANASNRGRFAIDTVVSATELDIKPAPNNAPILQTTFVADSTVQGTVTVVTVDAWRFSGTGDMEATFGNTSDAAGWTWGTIPVGTAGTVTNVSATAGGLANADTITVANPTTTPVIDLPNLKQNGSGAFVAGVGTPAIANVSTQTILGLNAGASLIAGAAPGSILLGTSAGTALNAAGSADLIAIGTQAVATPAGAIGSSNIAIGVQAGNTFGSGGTNIAIGPQAGSGANAVGTGTGNILIGSSVNMPAANLSGAVVIGNALTLDTTFLASTYQERMSFGATASVQADAAYSFSNNTVGGSADGFGILSLQATGGANGGRALIHVGSRNPDTNVTALQGSLYLRTDTATLYQNTDGATAWADISSSSGAAAKTTIPAVADPAPTAATLEANEITYLCDTTGVGGGFVVTLPSPVPANGTMVRVKWVGGNVGTEPLSVNSAAAIDGTVGALPLGTLKASYTFQSDGTNYQIV